MTTYTIDVVGQIYWPDDIAFANRYTFEAEDDKAATDKAWEWKEDFHIVYGFRLITGDCVHDLREVMPWTDRDGRSDPDYLADTWEECMFVGEEEDAV